MITYLEELDGFNTESVDEGESIFNLLATYESEIRLLKAEIDDVKKQIECIEHKDI